MNLYQRIIGTPWVYDRVRPWFLGGLDFQPLFDWLQVRPEDVLLDVGCGTGMALDYLKSFRSYHGFDVDQSSLDTLKARHTDERVRVVAEPLGREALHRIRPSRTLLVGLLHHLSDADAHGLLQMLADADFHMRIVSLDVAWFPDKRVNNLLAMLDRGRHVRSEQGYEALIRASGLKLEQTLHLTSGNGFARYLVFCLQNEGKGCASCND